MFESESQINAESKAQIINWELTLCYLPEHWLQVLLQWTFIQIGFFEHSPPLPQFSHATGYTSWQSKKHEMSVLLIYEFAKRN